MKNYKRFYKSKKKEYLDKVIPCDESPTGDAYIGINKTPLMPVKNGHGFQGVLLQDGNREFVQCHYCGQWARKITAKHLAKCGNLTPKTYKERYGLNQTTGLVSDELSLMLTKNALKNKTRRTLPPHVVVGMRAKRTVEYENKFGTCPLQLKTRLYEFILCNRELPAQLNRGRPIYKALVKRFGSWSHALVEMGLPMFKRVGTNMRYVFADGTVYKYNINKFHDREKLYYLLLEKCPIADK